MINPIKVAIVERMNQGKSFRLVDMVTGFDNVDEALDFTREFNTPAYGSTTVMPDDHKQYLVYARVVESSRPSKSDAVVD